MKILVRYLRQGPDGTLDYQDSEVSAAALTIGSAADRHIQLLGRLVGADHAEITGSAAKLKISCRRGFKVRVNDREVESSPVQSGDRIRIDGHQLALVNPPAGFDFAVEVQRNTSADAAEFETAFRTDLEQTWLSKRSGAWILATLVLLTGLGLPLWTIFLHGQGVATPAGLPDETAWSPGPLIPAHEHVLGQNCSACHQQLFAHVQDKACAKCHQSISPHVPEHDLALTHLGSAQRCAECHREHDGGASQIAARDDGLCVACHADSRSKFGTLTLEPAFGFARGAHPAFFVILQKPRAGAAGDPALLEWVARREAVAAAHEQSNLKFSHAQHLDASRVTRGSDGGALGCRDCHVPALDGEHFVPVTMASACASCHKLTFDPSAPARQLPHANAPEAMAVIEDYFAHKYHDPALSAGHPEPARRLPDRDKDSVLAVDTCTASANVCASRRAAAEIDNQFMRIGCVSCHVVNDSGATDIHERFQVLPVRLTQDYFADIHFSHRSHAIQKNLTGDAACLSCHAARLAKQSSDVMIPDIGKCLTCHSDRPAKERVTVQCVSCHTYHPVATQLVGEGRRNR
jgi:hypothetical protein